ncbi:MFS transporter [Microbacterium telephonicum]|uniref:Na+/melibiose symporter-like transporter n=1 Tax=Microbacterium telephonicum TaxID=1714841 RepID=A0A498BYN7_9MICO|nr:MFS transporter [Microbacterium telephonicum]RLK47939.1 Na+/melibiose symporter-like transporter [Microbacterium telephonicum]
MYISLTNSPTPASDAPPAKRGPRGIRTVSSTVITLGIVSMLTDISSESVSAILPLYITGFLGLSTIAFGVLDGLYQGTSAVVRIAGGYASDRLDQPKWVAFVGYALAAVARVGLLFWSGFAALTAVITADRIGKGIRTAPRDALITATSDPARLASAFGVHRMLDNIGAAIGPFLAFVILLVVPDGFHVVFVASLAFAAIGVAILALVVPNVRRRRAAGPSRVRVPWRDVVRGPMRRVLAAAGVLGLVTIGDGFVYLVLQARSDFAAMWFPLLYVGTNVAFLALAIPLGRLADRIGRARVFVWGHAGLLAAYVVAVLPMADVAATILCLAFLGGFYAATDGVLSALTSQLSSPDGRATAIASAQTVVAIARFVSAAGFGVLWFALGRDAAMLVVAVVLAVAIPLVALLLRPLLRAPGAGIAASREAE